MNSSSQLNTFNESTVPKDCSTCFYAEIQGSVLSPCERCTDFNMYAKDTMYYWNKENKVFEEPQYNVISKPKHYMLFEDKNIEVRDVIHVLLERMAKTEKYEYSPLDYSDYAQAMQYFMRFMDKNGVEDLRKGAWYINKLIENWEG